jgi:4-amino-4-deoxy-L-arabinose transferase-like glycosyltransferase
MLPLPSRFPLSHRARAALAPALLCLAAAAFRLADLAGRNFWTDEAWVALAALSPTPAQALAAGQSTPPLFMLSLWALAHLFGGSEAVLRSLPFLFGVGTVLLFWPLARALAPRPAALTALAAVACSPWLVYFSKELKQYSGDAFFAVLVLALAERLRAREGREPWAWLALAGSGLLGLGFSHALVFTLSAAALALWLALPSHRPRLALLGGLWALAFAAYYWLFFRHEINVHLVAYWAQDFPDFSGPLAFLSWLVQAGRRHLGYFLGYWGQYWGLPLLLAGLIALARGGSRRAWIYWGAPLLLALLAAAAHRYPFMGHYSGNRLMLFSVPLLYLGVAAGLTAVFAFLWRRRLGWLALGLTVLLAAGLHPLENLKENLHTTINREEIRPLVAALSQQRRGGDLVYVYYHAVSPFKYYYQGSLEGVCWGRTCVDTNLAAPAAPPHPPPRRLWLIASHFLSLEDLRTFAAGLLGPHWQETDCLTRMGAALLCFEVREVQAAKSPAARPAPALSGPPGPPGGKACE